MATFGLQLDPSAVRALQRLPEAVAAAVGNFLTGPLAVEPKRVGKPLGGQLEGYWSARRGAYRVVYAIDDEKTLIRVVRIQHRADVYRPL